MKNEDWLVSDVSEDHPPAALDKMRLSFAARMNNQFRTEKVVTVVGFVKMM